eukprot:COSAG01_NODE_68375_length_264_cov_0.630303_1_plen_33_part_01
MVMGVVATKPKACVDRQNRRDSGTTQELCHYLF